MEWIDALEDSDTTYGKEATNAIDHTTVGCVNEHYLQLPSGFDKDQGVGCTRGNPEHHENGRAPQHISYVPFLYTRARLTRV